MKKSIRRSVQLKQKHSIANRNCDRARFNFDDHGLRWNTAHKHREEVRADQSYGVILGDGTTLASVENRWVRKRLRREGSLIRKDRPKAA